MTRKYVFFDTNIYLSFFEYTNDEVKDFEKIVNTEWNIVLPEQVIDEFKRQRESTLNKCYRDFKESIIPNKYPSYVKSYEEYKQLRELEKNYANIKEKLHKKIDEHISNKELPVDKMFKMLIKRNSDQIIQRTSEIIESSRNRQHIGNPPAARDTIVWESLLSFIPEGEDLSIVSRDGDFYASSDKGKINEFLEEEWNDTKKSEIKLYKSINKFTEENNIDVNLPSEEDYIKNSLIDGLQKSNSFQETHNFISALSQYQDFSETQKSILLESLLNNNQINWIVGDADVNSFFKRIYEKYGKRDPRVEGILYG